MGRRDARVDEYLNSAAPFAQPILREVRDIIHATCPDVEETIKWGMPHFDYQGIMCSMASFKEHCAFGFWKGSLIRDAEGKGLGGDAMGSFGRITSRKDLPPKKVLVGYIRQAMALNEAGVKSPTRAKKKPSERPALQVPPQFAAALRRDAAAQRNFDAFSSSQRREYIEWINEAKREATRTSRIEKAVAQLAENKPHNWKYMK
jgi:uncharacterized protein YdeI (YjbR/CyaY-like superfamily)